MAVKGLETTDELDIITRIRGKVMSSRQPTGENLFLAWGYPTAFFLLLEFAAIMLWHEEWCGWIWVGIPFVGTPLMVHYIEMDYERTGNRTLDQKVILQMWIFVGCVSCIGGFAMGFAGVYWQCFFMMISLLSSMGCFLTGVILRFRPKVICGVIATVLSFVPLFLQDDLWLWQLPVTALVFIFALIIPGHLFKRYVRNYP